MSGYDGDVSVYDPSGRMLQLQYACESPRLGAPIVAIAGARHAVLVSVRRSASKLAEYTRKTFRLSAEIGCAASGIYADARKVVTHLRAECQERAYEQNEEHGLKELVVKLADEAQQRTQYSQFRPYGVALLFVGQDDGRPAVFLAEPDAEYRKLRAHCVGKNAQAANAYLAQHYNELAGAGLERLCWAALSALRQVGLTKYEPEAVEVAAFELGRGFRQLSERECADIARGFEEKNPLPAEESEDS